MAKLGFLGSGNMGFAILQGLIQNKCLNSSEIAVFDVYAPANERAAAQNVTIYQSEIELVENSEVVLVAVKPQQAAALLEKIGKFADGKLLLSIVAGYDVATIYKYLGSEKARVQRIMPNTPAMVGAGVFGLDSGSNATAEEKKLVESWLGALGLVEWVDESLFPVITGLSGGGPAYVAMFIDALADGGVKYGLKRDAAIRIASQTVLGSAKLVLESGEHPAIVKDKVCSPAGTTIDGVAALEEGAFRSTVIKAVESATLKSKNL